MMHRQHTYSNIQLHYCEITSGLCPGCVSPCSGSAPAVQTPSICLSSRTPRSAAPHPLSSWAYSLKNSITCFESLHNLILHIHADRKLCTTDKLGVSQTQRANTSCSTSFSFPFMFSFFSVFYSYNNLFKTHIRLLFKALSGSADDLWIH